jgi:transposase
MAAKKRYVPELSVEQRAALEDLRGTGYTSRTGKRAEAVLLSARGYGMDEISAITECHRLSVSHWLSNWDERGIDGLLEREGRGRKRLLTEDEESQAIAWLDELPNNAKGLAVKIEEGFGKKVSVDTVKRLIKRHGKVWKRVRSGPAGEPDPAEYDQCTQELVEYMEAAVEGEIDLFYLR